MLGIIFEEYYSYFVLQCKVFEFVTEQSETDSIEFEVYDEDTVEDDFLGR